MESAKRDARIGMRVTDAEKLIIETIARDRKMSVVDAVVQLFTEEYNNSTGKKIGAAEHSLELLVKDKKVNHFTITSVLGSIPEYVLSQAARVSLVKEITGKSPSEWEKEAQQALAKSEG